MTNANTPTDIPLPDADVLIVGAGPTGLTLACELARRHVPCRVVERRADAVRESRALGVQARTLEVFENMGVVGEATRRGRPLFGVRMHDGGRVIVHLRLEGLETPYPYLLVLPQNETEQILAAHLEALGGAVERGVELLGFTQDATGVMATLRHADGNESEARARYLVGCDGAHSAVREALGMAFEGATYPESFLLADAHIEDESGALPTDEFSGFLHGEDILGLIPMPGGLWRILADNPPPPADDAPDGGATLEEIQALADARGPGGIRVRDPIWTARFRIHRRQAARMQDKRVLLAGDAAHIHSPAGGQGMNTGIQDAFNLGWKLALVCNGAAEAGLLETYHAERRPVAEAVLRGTDALTRVLTLRSHVLRAVRDHVAPLLTGVPFVRRDISRAVAELNVHYGPSVLVEDHGLRAGPRAGERAPDGEVITARGLRTRLFEVMRDGRFTLLLFADDTDPDALRRVAGDIGARWSRCVDAYAVHSRTDGGEPSAGTLTDPDAALHERYGADDGALYLIRPDGFIGFRGTIGTAPKLLAWLERAIPRPESCPETQ